MIQSVFLFVGFSFCLFFPYTYFVALFKLSNMMRVVFENYHSLMKSMTFMAAPSSNRTKLARFLCLLSLLLWSKMVFALTIARFMQV